MDEDPVAARTRFSPMPDRPPLGWGDDRPRLAIWVVINCEQFDNRSLVGPAMAGVPGRPPDIANATWREYGNRVGVWRLFAMLQDLGVPATIALNSESARLHPAIVGTALERSWEIIGHGELNNRSLAGLDAAAEAEAIRRALDALELAGAPRPTGWLSPGLAETERTPDLLAEAGVRYVADWVLDDQPARIRAEPHDLVAMPYTLELNDFPAALRFGLTGAQFGTRIRDQYRQLSAESRESGSGRVMAIALHPFITGVPHRARHLRKALHWLAAREDTWFATGTQLLEASESWLAEADGTDG